MQAYRGTEQVSGRQGMKADTSFSRKLRAGWTKDELMKYYAMTEVQYDKVVESLEAISKASTGAV